MKLLFYSLIILVCVACASPKSDTKESSVVKVKDSIPLKDTIKQAQEETPKTVKLLSGKQLLDSLLKKAKYRDLKVIKTPNNFHCGDWKEDSLGERIMSDAEFNTLGLYNFREYEFNHKLYIWAYLGYHQNNHLFVILYGSESCSIITNILMVDSLGKYKDGINVIHNFRDMGSICESHTKRLNDSTFITYRKDELGNGSSLLENTHFIIQKDSFFTKKVDTLVYKKSQFF